jgi:methyl-accepting chemotaxis protein
MKLNDMRLSKRLFLCFGTLLAITLIITAVAFWGLHKVTNTADTALDAAEKKAIITDAENSTIYISLKIAQIAASTNSAENEADKASIEELRKIYREKMDYLIKNIRTTEASNLLASIQDSMTKAKPFISKAIDLGMANKNQEALDMLNKEIRNANIETQNGIDKYQNYAEKRTENAQKDFRDAVSNIQIILSIVVAFGAIIGLLFAWLISRSVTMPISVVVKLLEGIGKGNLAQHVPQELLDYKDEAGDLMRAGRAMGDNLRRVIGDINKGVETLASSSTELSAVASQTANSVKSVSDRSSTVAAAAEESSANTTSVAASMEQASTNLASVASATEEMSATVGEIASNSEKARTISTQATDQAQAISHLMQELGTAAQEIGKVTETITTISSQTNLLALNATIEAARAGAAGKGFAVVANEIKELARQTAAATEDIKAKIQGVQNSAGGAIADIQKITEVIKEVGHLVSAIAAAIEEQATVTKDVAGNIAQASTGVKDSNGRIAQTASVSKSIAQDIAQINNAMGDMRSGGEQVQSSAVELSHLAEKLKVTLDQFKIK